MWSLKQNVATTQNTIDVKTLPQNLALGFEVFLTETQSPPRGADTDFQLPEYVSTKSSLKTVSQDLHNRSITLGE